MTTRKPEITKNMKIGCASLRAVLRGDVFGHEVGAVPVTGSLAWNVGFSVLQACAFPMLWMMKHGMGSLPMP